MADVVTRAVRDVPVVVTFRGTDLLGGTGTRRRARPSRRYGVIASRRAAPRAAGIVVKSGTCWTALPPASTVRASGSCPTASTSTASSRGIRASAAPRSAGLRDAGTSLFPGAADAAREALRARRGRGRACARRRGRRAARALGRPPRRGRDVAERRGRRPAHLRPRGLAERREGGARLQRPDRLRRRRRRPRRGSAASTAARIADATPADLAAKLAGVLERGRPARGRERVQESRFARSRRGSPRSTPRSPAAARSSKASRAA